MARIFSISHARIKIESVDTTRTANTSPTVSSFSADLNGHATRLACLDILNRLKGFISRRLEIQDPDDIEIRNGTVYFEHSSIPIDTSFCLPLMLRIFLWRDVR